MASGDQDRSSSPSHRSREDRDGKSIPAEQRLDFLSYSDDDQHSVEEATVYAAESQAAAGSETSERRRLFSVAGKKAGLLRLFESDFFSTRLALAYLYRYQGDPGVQYYLCQRLRDPAYASEIEFLLPQLCHLMIRKSLSVEECGPLECFVVEFAERSLHAGCLVLWYLEGYMQDFLLVEPDDGLRARCVRLLQMVQRAIFKEALPRLDSVSRESFEAVDVLPDIEASLVGFGCILAAVAAPGLVQPVRPLLLMEARKADACSMPLRMIDVAGSTITASLQAKSEAERRRHCSRRMPVASPSTPTARRRLSATAMSRGSSFRRFVGKTVSDLTGLRLSSTLPSPADAGLVPTPLFYQPEMQFVASLVDIARRLCSIPREARSASLRSELAIVTNDLPAEICIPLWCSATGNAAIHDRVVRVDPSEAAVLNSAERAPYVVFVESIQGGSEIYESTILAIDKHAASEASEATSTTNQEEVAVSVESQDEAASACIEERQEDRAESLCSEKMHTAAVMLAQLAHQSALPGTDLAAISLIKQRIIAEMEELERERMLGHLHSRSVSASCEAVSILETSPSLLRSPEDPSASVLREAWDRKSSRIKQRSPFGRLPGWLLHPLIVKAGSDMRQEQLAGQLIGEFRSIWGESGLDIWVKQCRVLVATADGGLVETVTDAVSIHSIKKAALLRTQGRPSTTAVYPPAEAIWSLRNHYIRQFGSPDSEPFIRARDAFVASLAGYSLVCYLLQIRDRHNGNILIDKHGHVVHIDFGFMLSNSPGSVGFEASPFKLPAEYIELMGGSDGAAFARFKRLFKAGFIALRKHHDRILVLIRTMWAGGSELPCLYAGEATIEALLARFRLSLPSVDEYVDGLIANSANNVFTRLYDSFQYYANGVY